MQITLSWQLFVGIAGGIAAIIALFGYIFKGYEFVQRQKKQDELMNSLELGDSILTTSGVYGVVIDMVDNDVVIVVFGNNKNCRIPMRKTSIVEVEKPVKE